jgi:hypothetical protein
MHFCAGSSFFTCVLELVPFFFSALYLPVYGLLTVQSAYIYEQVLHVYISKHKVCQELRLAI